MRVSFSSTNLAEIAVGVLEAYGYSATQLGTAVITDCPTLLAVPAIAKHVGLAKIEGVDISAATAVPRDAMGGAAPHAIRLTHEIVRARCQSQRSGTQASTD
jgi:hypothetical protein